MRRFGRRSGSEGTHRDNFTTLSASTQAVKNSRTFVPIRVEILPTSSARLGVRQHFVTERTPADQESQCALTSKWSHVPKPWKNPHHPTLPPAFWLSSADGSARRAAYAWPILHVIGGTYDGAMTWCLSFLLLVPAARSRDSHGISRDRTSSGLKPRTTLPIAGHPTGSGVPRYPVWHRWKSGASGNRVTSPRTPLCRAASPSDEVEMGRTCYGRRRDKINPSRLPPSGPHLRSPRPPRDPVLPPACQDGGFSAKLRVS